MRAAVANAAWWAANVPAWVAFRRALRNPSAAQSAALRRIVSASSAFAREHGVTATTTIDQFRDRVPLRSYAELLPWVVRVRQGEPNVLTGGPVRRLVPTGGSTGGRKLVPYTAALQAEFNRAVGPWIVDLFHQYPSLVGGPAYWSISPVARHEPVEPSVVPIGFEDDAGVLGGLRQRLVDAVMAVPSGVRHAPDMATWRQQTMDHLRRANGLRLISVWHPSFLTLLTGDDRPAWPRLRLISCWADGHATLAAAALARQYPGVVVQPKGLIATEGIVSIPFAGRWPLAVRSHFLEFVDDGGRLLLAHELADGATYEVVLTTGGGLWRYRLGDRVRVDGFVGRTPSVRFVGRAGAVSDRFGEKLDEPFVAAVIAELSTGWRFAMLAPDGERYALFVEGNAAAELGGRLDVALRRNPHYAYCRDLGQLGTPVVVSVVDGDAAYQRRMVSRGQRAGDVKPAAVSGLDGWREHFTSH